ncbi:MAG: hypothetical protein OXE99_07230 [Cellvibrionales bacterium]|nr:hypothetical protein [Cellvibrionales bacterium]
MTKVFQVIMVGCFLSLTSIANYAHQGDVSEMHMLNVRDIDYSTNKMLELATILERMNPENVNEFRSQAIHKVGEAENALKIAIFTQKKLRATEEALSKQKLISYIGIPATALLATGFFVWYMNYKKQFQMGMPMVEDDE